MSSHDTINGLRDLANWLERHPELPAVGYLTINTFADTPEELARVARLTSWQKGYTAGEPSYMYLRKSFGNGQIQFDVNIRRERVCERIVVGTEIVPAQPQRLVEKVEWRCTPLLGEAQ